jgi:ABC-2 type transport system permease protein
MQRILIIYLRLISIQIRSQMQYQVSFWLELLSTGLLNATTFLTLALVLQRFGTISGWTIGEVAFLAGMVEMSFATMDMLFSGFDPDGFSPLVRMGSFDQLLLRPMSVTIQVFGSRFILRRVGRILEGIVIFVLGLALTHIHWTTVKLIYLPVVFISQVITFGALFIMGSTLVFWTIQPIEAVNIVTYGGNEMMTYPMSIYPGWLRRFFTYILPFIFLNYYPALYFLDKPDPLHFPIYAPFLAPVVAALLFMIALRLWEFGVNHYQGTGS